MSKVWKVAIVSTLSGLLILYLQKENEREIRNIDINYILRPSSKVRKLQLKHLKKRFENMTKQIYTYDKPRRFSRDLKFILRWTKTITYKEDYPEGQHSFIDNDCHHTNCYLTHDKNLLVDHRYYDAIVFEAEHLWDIPPYFRSVHQKYIFSASTADSHRLYCHPFYDTFYNLTWTYKLDSDIRWSFITIENKTGGLVGPKGNMNWVSPMRSTPQSIVNRLSTKKKTAAWFVSTCNGKSKRERVVGMIRKELEKYGLKIDVYGLCGTLNCEREQCMELLEEYYYFYFSFESELLLDYVTDQLMHPLLHMTVPVVFGGADYTRFLPPGSYIDAKKMNASMVAKLMHHAIENPDVYRNYFRWHNHYVYKSTVDKDICKLCEVLNDPRRAQSVVTNFRDWWHDNDDEICKDQQKLLKKYNHINLFHQL